MSPGDCTLQCCMWLWNHAMTVNSQSGSTLQCDMWFWDDIPLNSPGGSTLQCGRWLWDEIEFAQTSAILEFYISFWVRPYHRSRHVILHQSAKFYPNRTTLRRKKWRHVDFQDGGSQLSWILWVQ